MKQKGDLMSWLSPNFFSGPSSEEKITLTGHVYSFATAEVFEYVTHGMDQMLLYWGVATCAGELSNLIAELPEDCTAFFIHLKLFGRIIGNADYTVHNDRDPKTGKREALFSTGTEYGACEGLYRIFADLYAEVNPT